MLERIVRVHDVLLELGLLARELLHDRAKPLAGLALERHPAQTEIAQRMSDELPLDGPIGSKALLEHLEVSIERLVLAELGVELRDER